MNAAVVRGALLLAMLLPGTVVDAQPTQYSPEFAGYDSSPTSPVAHSKFAPAILPGGKLSTFYVLQNPPQPNVTFSAKLVRFQPDLGTAPEAPIDLSPVPIGRAGRIGVCGHTGVQVQNVVIRHIDPFPVFDVYRDDGVNATVVPQVNLGFGSIYHAMACSDTPDALRVFAHHDQTGNVQVYRVDGAVATQEDSGRFWFAAPHKVELAVKTLVPTVFSNRHWVFAAATIQNLGAAQTEVHVSYVELSNGAPPRAAIDAPNAVEGTGFAPPCPIVSAVPAPANLRAPLAVHLTGENSALVLHAVGTEIWLTRVADLANCGGVVSQVVPFPSSGSVFDYTDLALLGPTESPTLVGTRVVRATLGAGGDYIFDSGTDLPPAGIAGPRDAIDVGRAQPLVVGAAGTTGLRIMGDVATIHADGFESQ